MPTLDIGGKRVTVDDSFLSLSPEQQQQTVDEIAGQLGFGGESPGQQFQSQAGQIMSDLAKPDAPDAGTEIAAQRLARRQEKIGGSAGASDLFGNSFTLGLEDKVAGPASGASGLAQRAFGADTSAANRGFAENYNIGRRAQEIQEEQARERTGGLGTAAEIAGSLGAGALAKAPAAATALGRVLQTGKEAATLGAIQGAGDSQSDTVAGTLGDVATGGAVGGLLGGGLAGGMEVGRGLLQAGRAAGRGAQSLLDDEEGRAAKKVYQKLIDDGLTPEQAAARMKTRDTALINVGDENTLGLGRAASAKPGEGRTVLNKALDAQQKASQGKILDTVTDALGGGDKSFNTRIADMVADRAGKGQSQYQKAFQVNFGNKHAMVFDDLAKRVPADAVRNAQKIAQAEGRPFGQQLVASIDEAGNVAFKRTPSLQEWHYIQRGLRGAADSAYRQGVGEVGTAYKNLHKDVLKAMDDASPLYRAARKSYAEQSDLIDALQRGRDILSPSTMKNVDALADELKNLSTAEKDMVKIGLTRQIQDMLEATPDAAGDMVKKIFGTKAKREAIRAVFDSPAEFRKFEAAMGKVARETKAYRYVRTGSRTSFVDAEKSDVSALADAAGAAFDVAKTGGMNTIIQGAAKLLGGLGDMDPGVAREVAKLLVERDPKTVLRALSKSTSQAARKTANDELLRKAGDIMRALTTGSAPLAAGQAVQQR